MAPSGYGSEDIDATAEANFAITLCEKHFQVGGLGKAKAHVRAGVRACVRNDA